MARTKPEPEAEAAPELVEVHYTGDGSRYVIGLPADPSVTLTVSREEADQLIGEGIYAEGPGEPAPEPAPAPEPDPTPAADAPAGASTDPQAD